MTRKQMKKLADKLFKLEKIHQNPSASKEAKLDAEKQIMQITNMITCLPDGLNVMLQIDELTQNLLNNQGE